MPYSSHQNGVAERQFRIIFNRVRAVLIDAGLEQDFWGKALNYIVYTRNRLPSIILDGKIPYEAWIGKKPDLSHLKPFGCVCWCYDHTAWHQKLKNRGIKCLFMGYGDGSNQWRLWDIQKELIRDSAYVIFDENIQFIKPPTPQLNEASQV